MTDLQVKKQLLDRIYHSGFMDSRTLEAIADQWDTLTYTVLDLEKIPARVLQALLKDTYEALYFYHREKCVPRELCKLLLEMEEFLRLASLMEDEQQEQGSYCCPAVAFVVNALTQGFLAGEYDCEFPVLKIPAHPEGPLLLDLEKDRIEDLI